ncbi:hypothetical protein DGWBC_0026 [Dehalogenimonas sp. WBC-2]|nr:hypothetical protein DGWBC_0026 [Dehalogenimonas sp. WBC-2]
MKVAAVLKREPSDTRLLLAGKIPKIIAHYDDNAAAESAVEGLKSLGLTAMAIGDEELHQSVPGFETRNLELMPREIIFRDGAGHEKRIGADDIFLIIEGIIHTRTETSGTRQSRKLNIAGTLLMGGLPVFSKVNEPTTGQTVNTEPFIRLYPKAPGGIIVEISRSNLTSYTFLGTGKQGSSYVNFENTVLKLRELCPAAVFDNRLMKVSAAVEYSGRANEDNALNCQLMYLFHLMVARGE